MKGKNLFTVADIAAIRDLLKKLRNASETQQKVIRSNLRRIGFYISNYNLQKCTVDDFDALIKSGLIKVAASEIALHITAPSQTIQQGNKSKLQVSNSGTIATINFETIKNLQQAGFTGFVPIANLWQNSAVIPKIKGVYMVVRPTNAAPEFLSVGTGGFYRDKDPNVPIKELRANWVNDTCVIYIGQAGGIKGGKQPLATLQSRLRQYLRFGQGKAVGHQGGCYIWQLKDAANLLFCWKPLLINNSRAIEKELIDMFKTQYGKQPFANRKD